MSSNWRQGAAFEDEIKDSFDALADPHVWIIKIPDTRMLRFAAGQNFTAQKNISDFLGVYNGLGFTIEAKSSRVPRSFDVTDNIKEHQVTYPEQFEAAGGRSFFFICNRSKRGSYRCFVFTAKIIGELRMLAASTGRKSLKWEELEARALVELERLPMGKWDVAAFLPFLVPN